MLQFISCVLSHPIIVIVQIQGALIASLLAAGWAFSGVMRLRELRRVRRRITSEAASSACQPVPLPNPNRRAAPAALTLAGLSAKRGQILSAPRCGPLPAEHGSALACSSSSGGRTSSSDQQGAKAAVTEAIPPPSVFSAELGSDGRDVWPAMTVILPVKGARPHSHEAWRSHLALNYEGPLEFLFVVDDPSDMACVPLQRLMATAKGVDARLLTAPHATHSSQKICNILTALEAASPASRYVLCLDDDVVLHPGALPPLVAALLADPSLLMATGYPIDVPAEGAGMLTYCIMAYHLPLLIGVSVGERIRFVWGGCMLFPAEVLREDTIGIVRAWSNGGYSDDLIVAAKCGEAGKHIYCPSSAIFRQTLVANPTWTTYWNYLRRQLYVMDTWAGTHNRRLNHGMLLLHCWLSWALVGPALAVAARAGAWAAQVPLLATQEVYAGPGTAWDWLGRLMGTNQGGMCGHVGASLPGTQSVSHHAAFLHRSSSAWASDRLAMEPGAAQCGSAAAVASALAFVAACLLAGAMLRWMTGVVMELLLALHPQAPHPPTLSAFSWPQVAAGFFATNALVPICALYTVVQPAITWSGTRYWKRGGRIVRVQRQPP